MYYTVIIITFSILLTASLPLVHATETGQARQLQKLQETQAVDRRFADYYARLQKTPTDANQHVALAELYLERDLLELALTSFRRALMFDKSLAGAHVGLSHVYRKKDMKGLELEEMKSAVALAPDNDEYRYELAVLYMEPANFDYKKAKSQYKALKKKESPLAEKLAKLMQIDS